MTAPRTLYPRMTKTGPARAFTTDWQMSVRLLSRIFSNPMKLDWAAVNSDPESIVTDTMDMKKADSGLWKIAEAI